MRKLLNLLVATNFITVNSLSVIACQPDNGQNVVINFNVDKKPAKFDYNEYINKLFIVPLQIVFDYFHEKTQNQQYKNDETFTPNIKVWEDFFSKAYKSAAVSSINYDNLDLTNKLQGFTNKFSDEELRVANNDNKKTFYTIIPSEKPWTKASESSFSPKENSLALAIPKSAEFTNEKPTKSIEGYFYNYIIIANFKISYSVKARFVFKKVNDKVFLDEKIIANPIVDKIEPNTAWKFFKDVIKGINIEYKK